MGLSVDISEGPRFSSVVKTLMVGLDFQFSQFFSFLLSEIVPPARNVNRNVLT